MTRKPKLTRNPLGDTRQRVYEFVRRRILAGDAPTTREVQHHLGFRAVQSARQHLEALVATGRLVKLPGRSRGYRLPGFGAAGVGAGVGASIGTGVGSDGSDDPNGKAGFFPTGPLQLVPRLGRVQAGALSEAIEDPDGYLPVADMSADAELFALTVRGESMTDAGILPGDPASSGCGSRRGGSNCTRRTPPSRRSFPTRRRRSGSWAKSSRYAAGWTDLPPPDFSRLLRATRSTAGSISTTKEDNCASKKVSHTERSSDQSQDHEYTIHRSNTGPPGGPCLCH
jgi:SOS-response transcriptional repressor LexA